MPLHPAVQAGWDRARATGFVGYAAMPVAEARAHFSAVSRLLPPGPDMPVDDLAIPVAGGAIAARLYRPDGARGLCVYFHGGGWVLGRLADFDALCRELARRSGVAVLSVDYRLAPEHPFPVPVEDALAAVRWASAHTPVPAGIAVAGDSAGGNLATVAALALRGEIALKAQLLFNPCTDADLARPSYATYGTGYLLSLADVRWFLSLYAPGANPEDMRLAPLRTPDLTGAPPAWIGVAEHDVLRDEDEAYAAALASAGVPVTCRLVPGVMHAFARGYATVAPSDAAVSEAAAFPRAAMAG
ncbi:MAG: alpha/beta hydrolase [Rhodobacteraceae bacterium]|nr:alpha/beta hydrolase [Paracoccaceae bacterium]